MCPDWAEHECIYIYKIQTRTNPARTVGPLLEKLHLPTQTSQLGQWFLLCHIGGRKEVFIAFSAALGVVSRGCEGDLFRTPAALSSITLACSLFPYPKWLGSYPVSLYSAGDFIDCWACHQPAGGSLLSEFEILAAKKVRTGLGDPSLPIASFI